MKCYHEATEVGGKKKRDDREVALKVGWVGN